MTTEMTMAVDDDDNKVNGDGVTGDDDGAGAMSDDNDDNDNGDDNDDGDGAMGDGAMGYDNYENSDGIRQR